MAESQTNPNTINTFNKGMMKDVNETFMGEGVWLHARNAVNNSHTGELGVLGNEPSNIKCIDLPYTLIGAVPVFDGTWALFSTDDVNSEIGIFDANLCTYRAVVSGSCLNFKKNHLITGASRKGYNCGFKVYWEDGLNPSRVIDLDNPPYVTTKVKQGDCYVEQNITPLTLDCEQLRLSQVLDVPCVSIEKGKASGTLRNGSYQIAIAYSINQIRVTDYLVVSEVQPLFDHDGEGGSLDITVSSTDQDFDEFELVLISVVNQQTVAKKLGNYSVNQNKIFIDSMEPTLETIPLSNIPLNTPAIEKADGMFRLNNYLVRTGIYNKLDFNYQPLANNIRAKWVSVEYPANYYINGGNNTGYMRDEQYAFFIRWVYNTGDKSSSYHIPGRNPINDEKSFNASTDAIEIEGDDTPELWQVKNTATITSFPNEKQSDGGVIIAEGEMGYWESTEQYPDNKPNIWGNLCGKKIRHHKFPDNALSDAVYHHGAGGNTIRIMGVKFEGIQHPVDNYGKPITTIVGYEILRGSREGNKTVIAKGIINNMRQYDIPGTTDTKGLYQNYPYNDLRSDYFLTDKKAFIDSGAKNNRKENPLTQYRKDMFSFHSPDTTFSKPYLNLSELKVYSHITGTSKGSFEYVYKHPKFKQINESAIEAVADIVNIISKINLVTGSGKDISFAGSADNPIQLSLSSGPAFPAPPAAASDALGIGAAASVTASLVAYALALASYIGNMLVLWKLSDLMADQYTEKILTVFAYLIPEKQYATQYNSHGFYDNFSLNLSDNNRRKVVDSMYVSNNIQGYNNFRINNLDRNNFVLINISKEFADPSSLDTSRNIKSDLHVDINTPVSSNISSYYTGIKIVFPSQYGQLESIKQVPIYNCLFKTQPVTGTQFSTGVMFGGDIYIGRYTEKNPFLFFNDWLFDMPDNIEFDYRNHVNVAYPRYWINNNKIRKAVSDNASAYRHLDDRKDGDYHIESGNFYLSCNGVRDFFVESEVNLAYRDWDEDPAKRHYDINRYTDLNLMFRSDYIKNSNFYKYDYSLSVARLYNNYVSWGSLQTRDYDPTLSEKCYSYAPNRIMYSLPQELEQKQDNWIRFLPNNYIDMSSRVTALKAVGGTGALIMLENEAPILIQGVDTLQTEAGIKITIGDGGLFNQPMRNIMNTDDEYQYGSCQSKFAIVGIPSGVYWVSQEQGKIFRYGGKIGEISKDGGMKWWFAKYLPSQLLKRFPEYNLPDNPLRGIGCNMSYNNTNEILYVTKKDYKVISNDLLYTTVDGFYVLGDEYLSDNADGTKNINRAKNFVELGDPNYFEDASWTISYDTKNEQWLSFHDWHPDFIIPARSNFLTIKDAEVWRHDSTTESFCNFYGKDYPFEIEFVSSTGQVVNTVRSVEYILECYKYFNDGQDKYHLLDENFDRAIVYNSEQISGLLTLKLKDKNNPLALLTYPKFNKADIEIIYTKEENKYRFNQFVDITSNRGEFTGNPVPMFNVSSNGYTKTINAKYIDYNKAALEKKKFRHYANRVFLRKAVSGSTKMLFKLINTKLQPSYR